MANVILFRPTVSLIRRSDFDPDRQRGSKDVFVHISAVERAGLTGLADNQKVTFDIEAGRDGRESASNIALA